MDRRSFIQSLMAGAAVVMLPALGKTASVTEIVYEFPMDTVADLTAWMEHRFVCSEMEPRSFIEHRKEDLPKLYGFSADDVPTADKDFELVRITPFVAAYACEDENPEQAEKRLVRALFEKFSELPQGTPIVWRVKPQFDYQGMAEYGKSWMTREQIEDAKELIQVPPNVEYDFDTGAFKEVKRRYTLNKVRMRFALPTVDSDFVDVVSIPDGTKPIRI